MHLAYLSLLINTHDSKQSDKCSDYIERLAHKYMQNCTVESSTESESETNSEDLPGLLPKGFSKKTKGTKLQDEELMEELKSPCSSPEHIWEES
ncbi:uncharacterized protein LOC106721854 isoform X5 [Alligator sinensis]|uniref:Uncharacterized protein LOC106721854 isoform X5 n=1 Tax=Alligator sinensis TaxID=38654 RepID=A0A1U8CU54_ALLSI|nr:uncharacterized protein LOC106721854 isoform X5 [Alligator sinensis]